MQSKADRLILLKKQKEKTYRLYIYNRSQIRKEKEISLNLKSFQNKYKKLKNKKNQNL